MFLCFLITISIIVWQQKSTANNNLVNYSLTVNCELNKLNETLQNSSNLFRRSVGFDFMNSSQFAIMDIVIMTLLSFTCTSGTEK